MAILIQAINIDTGVSNQGAHRVNCQELTERKDIRRPVNGTECSN